jgi:hypothetical protein
MNEPSQSSPPQPEQATSPSLSEPKPKGIDISPWIDASWEIVNQIPFIGPILVLLGKSIPGLIIGLFLGAFLRGNDVISFPGPATIPTDAGSPRAPFGPLQFSRIIASQDTGSVFTTLIASFNDLERTGRIDKQAKIIAGFSVTVHQTDPLLHQEGGRLVIKAVANYRLAVLGFRLFPGAKRNAFEPLAHMASDRDDSATLLIPALEAGDRLVLLVSASWPVSTPAPNPESTPFTVEVAR